MKTTFTLKPLPTLIVGNNYSAVKSEAGEEIECEVTLKELPTGRRGYLVEYEGRSYRAVYNVTRDRFDFTF